MSAGCTFTIREGGKDKDVFLNLQAIPNKWDRMRISVARRQIADHVGPAGKILSASEQQRSPLMLKRAKALIAA